MSAVCRRILISAAPRLQHQTASTAASASSADGSGVDLGGAVPEVSAAAGVCFDSEAPPVYCSSRMCGLTILVVPHISTTQHRLFLLCLLTFAVFAPFAVKHFTFISQITRTLVIYIN